jgi:quercetin dioxygenase-like cupin family protein
MSKVIRIETAHSFVYDGARMNIFHADKGEGLPKHEHDFAHATMCHAGSCWLRKEGKEILITKETQPINLVANEWHEIEAAENGTVFCNVFSEDKY